MPHYDLWKLWKQWDMILSKHLHNNMLCHFHCLFRYYQGLQLKSFFPLGSWHYLYIVYIFWLLCARSKKKKTVHIIKWLLLFFLNNLLHNVYRKLLAWSLEVWCQVKKAFYWYLIYYTDFSWMTKKITRKYACWFVPQHKRKSLILTSNNATRKQAKY